MKGVPQGRQKIEAGLRMQDDGWELTNVGRRNLGDFQGKWKKICVFGGSKGRSTRNHASFPQFPEREFSALGGWLLCVFAESKARRGFHLSSSPPDRAQNIQTQVAFHMFAGARKLKAVWKACIHPFASLSAHAQSAHAHVHNLEGEQVMIIVEAEARVHLPASL